MLHALRRILWLGSSLNEVRRFPEEARKVIGAERTLVQGGDLPTDWKPVQGI